MTESDDSSNYYSAYSNFYEPMSDINESDVNIQMELKNQNSNTKRKAPAKQAKNLTFKIFEKLAEEKIIRKKKKPMNELSDLSYSSSSRSDSRSVASQQSNSYTAEFTKIQLYLKNKDFTKANTLRNKILVKEANKRKQESEINWVKLERYERMLLEQDLEQKLSNHQLENYDVKSKSKSILANVYPNEGYYVTSKEYVESNFIKEEFCDFIQYLPKSIENIAMNPVADA